MTAKRTVDKSQWQRETEGVLLGTLVNYAEYIDTVFEIVAPEQFGVYPELAGLLRQMTTDGTAVDYLTVKASANGHGADLEEVIHLYETANALATPLTVRQWATELRKHNRRVGLESDLLRCIDRLKSETDLTRAERYITDTLLAGHLDSAAGGLKSMREIATDHLVDFTERFDSPVSTWGISTGFRDLDKILGGFQNDSLYLIAARPSVGKTALALALANNIASRGKTVAFFSLEMSQKQLLTRLTCLRGKFNSHNVRSGKLGNRAWDKPILERFWNEYDAAGALPLWVDDRGGITTQQTRARLASFVREHDTAILIFDYINLAGNRGDNRNVEIGSVARGLKDIAKEFHIPVVALCQLNRDLEKRDTKNKEPQLSDLRDSGELEQVAQVVMFLHRDDYTNRNMPDYQPDHKCKVNVAKNQDGAVGFTYLHFEEEFTRFEDMPC